jgi:hypothetical protein
MPETAFQPDPSAEYTRKAPWSGGSSSSTVNNETINISNTSMENSLTDIETNTTQTNSTLSNTNTYIQSTNTKLDATNTKLDALTKGAANVAIAQTAMSTSAAQIVAARATRRSVTVKNMDASITVYVGTTAGVTSGNGFPLAAGEGLTIDGVSALYGIAASGTPSVASVDQYD